MEKTERIFYNRISRPLIFDYWTFRVDIIINIVIFYIAPFEAILFLRQYWCSFRRNCYFHGFWWVSFWMPFTHEFLWRIFLLKVPSSLDLGLKDVVKPFHRPSKNRFFPKTPLVFAFLQYFGALQTGFRFIIITLQQQQNINDDIVWEIFDHREYVIITRLIFVYRFLGNKLTQSISY